MNTPVNLNRFRKKKQRETDEKTAAENRVRFGRTRAEREADARLAAETDRTLDGKKTGDKD